MHLVDWNAGCFLLIDDWLFFTMKNKSPSSCNIGIKHFMGMAHHLFDWFYHPLDKYIFLHDRPKNV